MTNELSLNQLQSITAAKKQHTNRKFDAASRSKELRKLQDSNLLISKLKYVPGETNPFIPGGDMF